MRTWERSNAYDILPLMTGFVSHPSFIHHNTGPGHPERPDRLRAVYRALKLSGLLTSPDPFPDFKIDLGDLPRAAKPLIEVAPIAADEETLRLVHSQAHIDTIRDFCAAGGGLIDGADTAVVAESFDLAKLAAGATVTATTAVLEGRVKRAFAAARPPGHHAEPDRAMGFCLFSNIAIAARMAQKTFGVDHVAIIDFDVHHGNGTQAAFEDDPSVFFASLHQDPRTCYPHTGFARETGSGMGEGFTLNIPFPPGTEVGAYLHALDEIILPRLHDFGPEILFISAGFDAHIDDPLADIHLTEDGFAQITRRLVEFADVNCHGRVVSTLEGGYNLRALGRSVVKHVMALEG